MGNELFRREFLKKAGSISCLGALGLSAMESSAWGQSTFPSSQPSGSLPQFSREDLVHLFVGPWRGLRAVIEKKVIDFHCHLAMETTEQGYRLSADELIQSMDRHGIGKACLPKSKASVQAKIPYEEDLRVIAKYPDRLISLCAPEDYNFDDPREAAKQVMIKLQNGAKAIGELNFTRAYDGARVGSLENTFPTMELAEGLDVPVIFGTRAGEYAERAPSFIAALASKFPRVKMIIGDAGGRGFAHGGGWDAIVIGASFPNLYIEIGGAPVEIIDAAVKHMGAEKVLFGSNFTSLGLSTGRPVEHSDGAQHWRNLNAVALSNTTDAQQELILYKNAERLLKL